MSGVVTIISQPIDMIIGWLFKGCYKKFYTEYMITAPFNTRAWK